MIGVSKNEKCHPSFSLFPVDQEKGKQSLAGKYLMTSLKVFIKNIEDQVHCNTFIPLTCLATLHLLAFNLKLMLVKLDILKDWGDFSLDFLYKGTEEK